MTAPQLAGIMDESLEDSTAWFNAMVPAFDKAQINTPLRIAHCWAQLAHESNRLRWLEEKASGAAYEGRKDLGNVQAGDGMRFKGRGPIQITGRSNYAALSKWCGVDLVKNPERLALEKTLGMMAVGWYWDTRKLNAYADQDNILTITKRINGGLNGIDGRRAYLDKAKAILWKIPA